MSTCPDADTEPYVLSRHHTNGNSVTHGQLPRVRAGPSALMEDDYVYPVGLFLIGWCIQIRET